MGNLWKAGQIGTRVLAGAAGSIFGPAGAAIGAGVVGPMIADLAFGPGQTREKQLYNWNEPTSFASYQDNPSNRLSATTITEDPNLAFKGTLKTVDSLVGTIGSFLPGNWGKGPDIGDKLFKKSTGNLAKTTSTEQGPLSGLIGKFAEMNTTENRKKDFNGVWEGTETEMNAIRTRQQPNDILHAYGAKNFDLWNMDDEDEY